MLIQGIGKIFICVVHQLICPSLILICCRPVTILQSAKRSFHRIQV